MATFRVGQRVKLIGGSNSHTGYRLPSTSKVIKIGSEGTVIRIGPISCEDGTMRDYEVKFDSDPESRAISSYQLVPLYDGHSKVSWSDCLWAPNKENVSSVTAS